MPAARGITPGPFFLELVVSFLMITTNAANEPLDHYHKEQEGCTMLVWLLGVKTGNKVTI